MGRSSHVIGRAYIIEITIDHDDCGYLCYGCRGSGEGIADGTTCLECKGMGEIKGHCQGHRSYIVEWFDKDDWEVTDGDRTKCDGCGYNFLDDIRDELEELEEQGRIKGDG